MDSLTIQLLNKDLLVLDMVLELYIF